MMTVCLLGACTRLLDLLDTPEDIPFLSPLIQPSNVAAGTVRDIAQYPDGLTISGCAPYRARISFSPDRHSLATSAISSQSDLWLLEGYPRPRPWWQLWK
jgi:hypothetical protein